MASNIEDTDMFGGLDPSSIKSIIGKIPPNPVTGRVELHDIMKFRTAHPDEMGRLMAKMTPTIDEVQVDLDGFDFASLANTIVHESFWVVQLDTVGFIDQAGEPIDPNQVHIVPGSRPACILYCYDDKEKHRCLDNVDGLPTTDVLIRFIKCAIVNPHPPLKPCLPWFLLLSSKLQPHAESLSPFLDSLPKPFHWRVETAEEARALNDGIDQMNQRGVKIDLELAEKAKATANAAFKARDRAISIQAYGDAIQNVIDALSQSPNEEDAKQAKSLLAICYANRAAAYLLPGPGLDAAKALSDGRNSVKVDPDYAKGYIRQATAWQLLGDVEKAKDVVAEALTRTSLEHEEGLVDRLVDLYTDGKGLSDDEGVFKNWYLDILLNDQSRGQRLKNVRGAWADRIDKKFCYWARLREQA